MQSIINIFSSEIVSALGWTIVHSLWQASIIAFVMSIVLSQIKNEKAQLRYNVASFSMFAILIMSVCT